MPDLGRVPRHPPPHRHREAPEVQAPRAVLGGTRAAGQLRGAASAGARWGLAGVPAEALFVLGAITQYIGAAIAVKLFARVEPGAVAWLRVALSAAICLLIARAWRRRDLFADIRAAALFGAILAFMNFFFYLAIARLPLGTAVAIEFIGPIAVAALGARTPRAITSLVVAFGGVGLLSEISLRGDPLGLVFIAAAAVCWALYILLGHRFARRDAGIGGIGLAMGLGALVLAPVAGPTSGSAWTDAGALGLIAVVGLLSNVVPYGLDQVALRRLDPSRFALLLALLPVTATLVGLVALGQQPTLVEAIGIGLVICGIAVRDRTGEGSAAPADPVA